ncbi:glycosyltransferase family 2 protein [Halomonas sp. EF61]|uniref:glycosyltransferase family 2 protein n=1 Tax=Halomonas sp. EF61 TaxID=2950869 RepID=UPI0032DEFCA3
MALPQEVAVIIPALNESSTIGDVVSAVKRYGTVYVVDDGSDDNTGEVAAEAGALVVTHSSNLGYDSALNSGFARAARDKVRFFVTVDADGQHKTQLLEEFILRLEEGFDVVLGERTSLPRFFEKVFSLFTRVKYSIKDPFCGMKGYSRPVYESLGHFDSYSSVGTELMFYALKNNFSVTQITFSPLPREDKPRFGTGLKANSKIIRAMVVSVFKYGFSR